jgi:carboxymethylenebutenolidase
MAEFSIQTPHHALNAYVATPAGLGPWPGIIVIHDVFGMTPDLRRHTDWAASAGYLAVAPDLYSWGGKMACLIKTFGALAKREGVAFDDIDAVSAWMRARPDCTGRIGITGFCMGGAFALFTAAGHGFDVSGVNYGMVPKDVERLTRGACPIVGSFGAKDRTLPGAAARLEAALTLNGVRHDVKEYPDAGHSFFNNHDGLGFKLLGPLIGGFYHAPTEADARRRILEFFGRYLKPGAAPADTA